MSQYRRRLMMMVGTGGPTPPPSPLPAGAIPCDILYSDGISSFIPTTFVPSPTMSFEAEMIYVIPTNSFISPFGYAIDGHRFSPIVFENSRFQVGYNGWYWGSNLLYPKVIRLRMEAIMTPSYTKVDHYNLDGTLYDSQTISYNESSFTPANAISLLGRLINTTTIYSGSWRGGLGRLRCYSDDHKGTLVADFCPCYYQGNFGFWETIGQTFNIGNTPANIGGLGAYWDSEGFWPNIINDTAHSSIPYLTDDRSYITSRDFEVPQGCTQVQFRVGASSLGGSSAILMCLNSDKSYRDWYSYNAVDRVVTLPSGTAYIRLSIPKNYFGDAWLKDYTNNQYIWKGQNVT